MRFALLFGILGALAAPGCSSAAGCSGLSGRFSVVLGSAGAGNIVYALRLHNGGSASCTLRGLPALRLLGASGKALSTHVLRDPRFKAGTSFVLRPGKTATATARFSPDVPGPGETGRQCEPVAHTARVSAAGLSVVVPLRPPTSVCEHGRLTFTTYR
jgi:hypothetical protein